MQKKEATMLKRMAVLLVAAIFFTGTMPVFADGEDKGGPNPSAKAYEHANEHAKFKRLEDVKGKEAGKAKKEAEKAAGKAKKEAEKAKKAEEKAKRDAEKEAKKKEKEARKGLKKGKQNFAK